LGKVLAFTASDEEDELGGADGAGLGASPVETWTYGSWEIDVLVRDW
jgi:hypothetical protein